MSRPCGRYRALMSRRSPRSRPRTSRTSVRRKRSPTPRPRFSPGSSPTASPSSPTTRRTATGWARAGAATAAHHTPSPGGLARPPASRRRPPARIIPFGGGDADVHAIHAVSAEGGGSLISACLLERELTFTISQRGEHWVSNALAVLAAIEAVGEDVAVAGLALGDLGGLQGRGERHVIAVDGGEVLLVDESYNANPASMTATLKSLGAEKDVTRRIAVLGPMRELGEHSGALHAGLASAVLNAHVDELILIGDEMRPLAEQVVGKLSLDLVNSVEEATDALLARLHPGDAVLVKASNSVGLAKLVERMVRQPACST